MEPRHTPKFSRYTPYLNSESLPLPVYGQPMYRYQGYIKSNLNDGQVRGSQENEQFGPERNVGNSHENQRFGPVPNINNLRVNQQLGPERNNPRNDVFSENGQRFLSHETDQNLGNRERSFSEKTSEDPITRNSKNPVFKNSKNLSSSNFADLSLRNSKNPKHLNSTERFQNRSKTSFNTDLEKSRNANFNPETQRERNFMQPYENIYPRINLHRHFNSFPDPKRPPFENNNHNQEIVPEKPPRFFNHSIKPSPEQTAIKLPKNETDLKIANNTVIETKNSSLCLNPDLINPKTDFIQTKILESKNPSNKTESVEKVTVSFTQKQSNTTREILPNPLEINPLKTMRKFNTYPQSNRKQQYERLEAEKSANFTPVYNNKKQTQTTTNLYKNLQSYEEKSLEDERSVEELILTTTKKKDLIGYKDNAENEYFKSSTLSYAVISDDYSQKSIEPSPSYITVTQHSLLINTKNPLGPPLSFSETESEPKTNSALYIKTESEAFKPKKTDSFSYVKAETELPQKESEAFKTKNKNSNSYIQTESGLKSAKPKKIELNSFTRMESEMVQYTESPSYIKTESKIIKPKNTDLSEYIRTESPTYIQESIKPKNTELNNYVTKPKNYPSINTQYRTPKPIYNNNNDAKQSKNYYSNVTPKYVSQQKRPTVFPRINNSAENSSSYRNRGGKKTSNNRFNSNDNSKGIPTTSREYATEQNRSKIFNIKLIVKIFFTLRGNAFDLITKFI